MDPTGVAGVTWLRLKVTFATIKKGMAAAVALATYGTGSELSAYWFDRLAKAVGALLGRTVAAGCWWLDGTEGFPRQCRICRTLSPVKRHWSNDGALPLDALTL